MPEINFVVVVVVVIVIGNAELFFACRCPLLEHLPLTGLLQGFFDNDNDNDKGQGKNSSFPAVILM